MSNQLEKEMREALFPGTRRKAQPAAITPGLQVDLSVRDSFFGGFNRKFTYHSQTISVIEAECKAQQAARKAGWTVVCVLETRHGS